MLLLVKARRLTPNKNQRGPIGASPLLRTVAAAGVPRTVNTTVNTRSTRRSTRAQSLVFLVKARERGKNSYLLYIINLVGAAPGAEAPKAPNTYKKYCFTRC